jgi:proteasome alpha subunit
MTDEPYRWLETIEHRREYIRDQLKGGSPVVAISRPEGILLLGLGQGQTKVFEVYDRHGLAAFGHPVDIERVRQMIIEAAHVEGFTRSPEDVTLRRLINFSLSPRLKAAFDQIFAPAVIVETLLAEVGATPETDLLARVHFDGEADFRSGGIVVAAQKADLEKEIAEWLGKHIKKTDSIKKVASLAVQVILAVAEDKHLIDVKPGKMTFDVPGRVVEAALLERSVPGANHYKALELV